MQRTLFCISTLLAALLFTGTAMAQEANPDCAAAKQYLTEQYSRSDPGNNEKYYDIWSSPECVRARKNAELYVDAGIESNERLIRQHSEDYDARLAQIPDICEPIVEKRWSESSDKSKLQQKKSEILASCIRNQSHALRAEFLNRVNEDSETKYTEKLRQNREQIAADELAQQKLEADYKIKMEKWQEAVRRCNAGDTRYCSLRF